MGVDKRSLDELGIDREAERAGGGTFWIVLVLFLVLLAAGAGYWYYQKNRVLW